MLRLTESQVNEILAHCLAGLPDEACGLLAGPATGQGVPLGPVTRVYPCENADASARTYSIAGPELIKAIRDAEGQGAELVGVFHSHTHSEPYPSETDVSQAFEPYWFYVLVGLKRATPELRAYHITDGAITEVPIEVTR